jgi:hypothetical protein
MEAIDIIFTYTCKESIMKCAVPLTGIAAIALCTFAVQADNSLGRTHTSLTRLKPERLEATHQDVQQLRSSRATLDTLSSTYTALGLKDYRATFHTHAGDSAHTGGTPEEFLEAAKSTGLDIAFLSDHYRPPRDFMESWRGVRDGVLFIPGSESSGFLLHPDKSVVEWMGSDRATLKSRVAEGTGMLFLSHAEDNVSETLEHATGMEIYNRHYDAKDDMAILFSIAQRMTSPDKAQDLLELVAQYPEEVFGVQQDYPQLYLDRWDAETKTRRVVGVGANDCHHNNVLVLKKKDDTTALLGTVVDDDDEMRSIDASKNPGLQSMMEGKAAGDTLVTLDIDPYPVAVNNMSTHIFSGELTESAVRKAVAAGHVYVSHDWLCDPEGFFFWAENDGEPSGILGDEVSFGKELALKAQIPLNTHVRLLRNGEVVKKQQTDDFSYDVKEPGTYRLEAWVTTDGEERPWIYSNPIYVR